MRGQIKARESLWIPFWQKRNPASFETYLETLPPNEFLTFTLADVFRPGGSSIKRSNLRRFKISIGGQDAISAHSPKAMTREAIWQKTKDSPENITLWLQWTSRGGAEGGSFLVVETKQSIFWKTMQLLAIDDRAQLKQPCFKRKRVTAPKS